jgi:hypothetical protein
LGDCALESIEKIECQAEDVCKDKVRLRGVGTLELRYEPSNWYDYDPDDAIMVNRHDFLLPLVQHYILTNSAEAKRKLAALFSYWLENFDVQQLRRCDTPIDAAIRLINWLWVFNTDALELSYSAASRLARCIYLQLDYIYSRFSAGGNHLVLESLAVFIYGCIASDSRRGGRWKTWGDETLRKELIRQTTNDGVHSEQSMFYHQAVATHFLKYFLAAKKFEVQSDSDTIDRFRRMLDYVHNVAMPDLTHPVVGDGEPLVTDDREHWESRALLAARWVLFDEPVDVSLSRMIDDSCIWLLGRNAREIVSAHSTLCTRVYRESGLAVLRASDAYVFVDAAPFSDYEFPHHGHADALSFVVCVGSEQLLVDPGGYGYYDDEFRRFFRSTAAHNTISLDDRDQSQLFGVLGYGRLANARIEEVRHFEDVDCVLGSHDGYRPVSHSRAYFLCKQPHPTLVIVDQIEGVDTHRAVSRFHAAPGVMINIEKNQLITSDFSSVFNFALASTVPIEQQVECGRRNGHVQGWVSPETRKVVAAETLEVAFDTQEICWMVAAFSLRTGIPVAAKIGAYGTAEVSIGEHAYSLSCAKGRLSAQPL